MIFPWNDQERRHQRTRPKNGTVKVIALFLIAFLLGALFIWRRYTTRYTSELKRLKQELQLNQADKNRARLKYEIEQKRKQMRQIPVPPSSRGRENGLPPGSIPHRSQNNNDTGSLPSQQGFQPPPIIQPTKPR
jgi:HAMP domain-containing protein